MAVAIRLERGHSQTGFAIVDTHLACTCRLSIRFANQDQGFLFADSSHFHLYCNLVCIAESSSARMMQQYKLCGG